MNAWLIQIGELLPIGEETPRMRTAMLAETLKGRGHEVLWWTSAFDHFSKNWIFPGDTELVLDSGIKIKALKGLGYKENISLSRFLDHRIIARKFKRLAPKMKKPDVIVASTPAYDVAYRATLFGRAMGIPTIIDIRDEWPDLFLDYVPGFLRPVVRLVLNREFVMAREMLKNADSIIAVMDTFLNWGLRYADRERSWRDAVFYLGHKRAEVVGTVPPGKLRFLVELKGKFIVTFVGTFVDNNDPSIIVDSASKLGSADIAFVLAGDGEYRPLIQEKARNLKNVFFPGWLNSEEIAILLRRSHVGVCPTSHSRSSFPNKSFAYLSEGLPILSAFEGDLKALLHTTGTGFWFPPRDEQAFIRALATLYEDKNLYQEMSRKARMLSERTLDAEKIYSDYATHVEEVALGGRIRG
jgi:glycosyltransferase involved in cell wall biosynthesis